VANEYSRRWFESFLGTIPEALTATEVAAIAQRIPLPQFRRVLDVCCGPGRHALRLAELGYEIVGVDRDPAAVAEAVRSTPAGTFHVLDQRDLASLDGPFDAAMILWQSFGYFDAATNDRVLGDIAGLLRPGGRLLLDLYHPGFMETQTGRQLAARASASIENRVADGRLISTITYADGAQETMDFELLDPDDLAERAGRQALVLVEACSWWDSARPPSAEDQRYQLVFERSDTVWHRR
jgi:SAM-dependent methyltransferase